MADFVINKPFFLVFFLLVGWLVFFIPQCTGRIECGGIAEEGTQHELMCYTRRLGFYFLYCRDDYNVSLIANDNITTATCNDQDVIISSSYSETLKTKCERSRLIVTITNASRIYPFNMETNWSCKPQCDHPLFGNDRYRRFGKDTCSLKLFAKPKSPACGMPVLNPDTLEMRVTCLTERVYPKALCLLYLATEHNETETFTQVNVSSATYKHRDLEETVPYYQTECTLTWPLATLIDHGTFFKVRMYPEDRGGPKNGVDSQIIQITLGILSKTTTNRSEILAEGVAEEAAKNVTATLVALAVFLAITTCTSIALLIKVCRMSERRNSSENRAVPKVDKESASSPEPAPHRAQQREDEKFKTTGHSFSSAEAYETPAPGQVYCNQPQNPEDEDLYEAIQGAEIYENL